jgi:hypothetical protein
VQAHSPRRAPRQHDQPGWLPGTRSLSGSPVHNAERQAGGVVRSTPHDAEMELRWQLAVNAGAVTRDSGRALVGRCRRARGLPVQALTHWTRPRSSHVRCRWGRWATIGHWTSIAATGTRVRACQRSCQHCGGPIPATRRESRSSAASSARAGPRENRISESPSG